MLGSCGPATSLHVIRWIDCWELGCIACRLRGLGWVAPEQDHRNVGDLAGMKRVGHDATLPLCCWHHRGIPWDGWTARACEEKAGPSKQLAKKRFIAEFGSIDELYEKLTAMLQAMGRLANATPRDEA